MRFMTYNIRWGFGADKRQDLDRIVDAIRQVDADVVLLNEVNVNWRRSRNVDQPQWIARETGYPHVHFLPSWRIWASGNMRLSAYGNALLSRPSVTSFERYLLPRAAPWRERRVLLAADLQLPRGRLTVMGTHLGLHKTERLAQTARLLHLAAGRPRPVVLLGDFNAEPGSLEIRRLVAAETGLNDAFELAGEGDGLTYPYPHPRQRIDYIFVSHELVPHVQECRALSVPGSDHLPVIASVDDGAWS